MLTHIHHADPYATTVVVLQYQRTETKRYETYYCCHPPKPTPPPTHSPTHQPTHPPTHSPHPTRTNNLHGQIEKGGLNPRFMPPSCRAERSTADPHGGSLPHPEDQLAALDARRTCSRYRGLMYVWQAFGAVARPREVECRFGSSRCWKPT